MAIFLDGDSRLIVQGMTGSEGMKHTTLMLAAGSNIVGGVNPKKAGQTVAFPGAELPVFGTVAEAMAATGANVSVVFVPPAGTKGAVTEAIDAGMPLVVVITEGVPVHDTAAFFQDAVNRGTTRIIGPNCPGIITPGVSNAGIIPASISGRGADRAGQQVRHPDLPDDVRAAGHRVLHRDRHRRGPDHRDDPHRRPRRVRGRPADRGRS